MKQTAMAAALMNAFTNLTPEQLAGLGLKPAEKAKRDKPTPEVTAARKANNDAECIKVFTEAGYKDVQPRVNVLTYGKEAKDGKPATGWISQGRRVVKGQKGHQVGPFNLFHLDQTEALQPVH